MRFLMWYWRLTKKAFTLSPELTDISPGQSIEAIKEELRHFPKKLFYQVAWAIVTSVVCGLTAGTVAIIWDNIFSQF